MSTILMTPALCLDVGKLQANSQAMHAHVKTLGGNLRPHVKTLKCIEATKAAFGPKPIPITVSTLAEAKAYAEHGYTDIFYAVGLAMNKVADALSMQRQGVHLTTLVDHLEAAKAAADKAQAFGGVLNLAIEIDSDGDRAGLLPDSAEVIELGKFIHAHSHTELAGVLTHAGGSYACQDIQCITAIAEQERVAITCAAQQLRDAGLPCPIVSMGSTPTVKFASSTQGCTEVRAGVFTFYDLVMERLGVCTVEDIAIHVASRVIGHRPRTSEVIIDAGWMALSRDHKAPYGHGLVCDDQGQPLGAIVKSLNQEHGIIGSMDNRPLDLPLFPHNRLLRVLPIHACATGAQFDRYHLLGDEKSTWQRFGGW